MKLLLDTHIWIWALLDPSKLSNRVAQALRSKESELWLSSISMWELSLLVSKNRIQLDSELNTWIDEALRIAPIREAPVSFAIVHALESIKTPHLDPADRFLAATASALNLQLVTSDERLIAGSGYQVFANC